MNDGLTSEVVRNIPKSVRFIDSFIYTLLYGGEFIDFSFFFNSIEIHISDCTWNKKMEKYEIVIKNLKSLVSS